MSFSALKMWIVILVVDGYRRFGRTYRLHLQVKIVKMEAVCFSETLVTTYKTTRRHNPEYHNSQGTMNFTCFLCVWILVYCGERRAWVEGISEQCAEKNIQVI
jgi:hypothetical protein